MKVDLHCHTNISDCSLAFDEILELAVKEGVSHLAITNHDTTTGLDEMVSKGKEKSVEIIPGIEISAYDYLRKKRVHILGYYIEPNHPELERLCGPTLEKRHQASYLMVGQLIEAGYDLSWEQVLKYAKGSTAVYKQHIMHALIDNGYTTSIYGPLYKKLFSRGQNGEASGVAFVSLEYVNAQSAIQAIRQAGGIPVLAHPGQYGSFEAVPELVEGGLQGIEVWHPLHSPKDEQMAKVLAKKYGLIMTGGTDFHGFYGEQEILLGSKDPGLSCIDLLKSYKSSMSV